MPFVTSRSVSRDSRAPRKTGFLGASQRAYTLSRAVYDRLTLRASPIYNTDTRRGPARAKAKEKYASNAACPHNMLQSARKNARDSHAGHNDASRRIARGHNAGVVLQATLVAVRGAEERRLPARRHLEGQSRPTLHAIDATTQ